MRNGTARQVSDRHRRSPLLLALAPACLVAWACSTDDGARHSNAVDAAAAETGPSTGTDVGPAAKPEAQIGFVSGTPCQAATQCLSGACTLGVCSDWAHVIRIAVDTTASGADIKESLSGFPLLVRLDDSNFPFQEASDGGADVRFVDLTGQTLAHEIERWDDEQHEAAIWVLLPTVEGNSLRTATLMYFGNPAATTLSSGPAVFSPYGCVLHMDPSSEGETELSDASGRGNDGRPQIRGRIDFDAGIALEGIVLDGRNGYIASTSSLPAPKEFTASMWFKTTTTSGGGLLTFAVKQTENSGDFDRTVWMDSVGRLHFGVSLDSAWTVLDSVASYNDGNWHWLVAQLSTSAGQRLLVDGLAVDAAPTSTSADAYSGYWRFGDAPILSLSAMLSDRGAASNYFAGIIDEVRISPLWESDAWIKLEFATQSPAATAVGYQAVP